MRRPMSKKKIYDLSLDIIHRNKTKILNYICYYTYNQLNYHNCFPCTVKIN